MYRTRTLAVVLLLLLYGTVGARQPAVRTSVPLGAPAATFADALRLSSSDRGGILLDAIRLAYDAPDGEDAEDGPRRRQIHNLLNPATPAGETVPLPLDPSVWRESILRRSVPDARLIATILDSRPTALLYHGLASLDDETLGALGPDRDTLKVLLEHAGTFAVFGRSLVIHAGRATVPGGPETDALWEALVGAPPSKPAAFARRLIATDRGRLAYFFDTIAHLDPPAQRFALGAALPASDRKDRVRALYSVFEAVAPEWRPDDRPFLRPRLDPALTLSLLRVTADGRLAGPSSRRIWTRAFAADDPGGSPAPVPVVELDDDRPVDAAWLIARIHRADGAVGRRRLSALLFAQRALDDPTASDTTVAAIARAFAAYPSLMLTLEPIAGGRIDVFARAAARARTFAGLRNDADQRRALVLFQSSLGLVSRIAERGGRSPDASRAIAAALIAIDPSEPDYAGRIAHWVRRDLLSPARGETLGPAGDADASLLDALSGTSAGSEPGPFVRWEGRAYRVDVARAERERLARIRAAEGGGSLDAALTAFDEDAVPARADSLAVTLASFLYAAHLGEVDARALAGGNPVLRHDIVPGGRLSRAWEPPVEELGNDRGWHLSGSLLTMQDALARHALRRLDATTIPPQPRLTSGDRRTASLTAALLSPMQLTDASRDEIAAALARGRARLGALTPDRDSVSRAAHDAGLSEWRREALAWTIAHQPERVAGQLSLLETFWLGTPRPLADGSLDAWGATLAPLTGCPCLAMPRARPWEDFIGRPAQGLMASRGADVGLRVADMLAEQRLPAALAPALVSYAMQDVLDESQPSYYDDWAGFTRTAEGLPSERLEDYVAALAAAGPLFPDRPARDRAAVR